MLDDHLHGTAGFNLCGPTQQQLVLEICGSRCRERPLLEWRREQAEPWHLMLNDHLQHAALIGKRCPTQASQWEPFQPLAEGGFAIGEGALSDRMPG